ncbi:MAG TPA: WD40 repeat domain-containing protein, partial [Burkholderiaceae bacterium]|nr:WD40 repeat domain-containing protein [Burkholderiaceae bacterium]
MERRWLNAAGAALLAGSTALHAQDVIEPNANLRTENIPPIPKSLAERVDRYTQFRPFGFVGWHPVRDEMIVRHRLANAGTVQLHGLSRAGGPLDSLTAFPDPVTAAAYPPQADDYLIYLRDSGGNEANRLFRLDLDTRASTPISPADERAAGSAWMKTKNELLVTTLPLDRTAQGGKRDEIATTMYLVDPRNPNEAKRFGELPGAGWGGYTFSPDDKTIIASRSISATESQVWRIDVATGQREQLLPKPGDTRRIAYDGFAFSLDGKRLFLTTNERGEFSELASYAFETRELQILSAHIPWDAERFALSWDGKQLAVVFNVDGRDELRMFDAHTGRELPRPAVPSGAITGLSWHRTLTHRLGFSVNSPQSPGDAYVLDTNTGKV